MIINYIIAALLGILLGQVVNHLIRRIPLIIEDKKAYKKLIPILKQDFKTDIKYSLILIVLFILVVFFVENTYLIWIYMILISMLIVAFVIDFKMQLIPDTVQLVILILGIIVTCVDYTNALLHIIGMVIGGGVFLLIAGFSKIVFRKEGMGMGDIKLMAGLGLIFKIERLPESIMDFFSSASVIFTITILSFFMAAIVAIVLILAKKTEKSQYMAFGPYITIATIVIILFGTNPILDGYFYICGGLADLMTNFTMKLM